MSIVDDVEKLVKTNERMEQMLKVKNDYILELRALLTSIREPRIYTDGDNVMTYHKSQIDGLLSRKF